MGGVSVVYLPRHVPGPDAEKVEQLDFGRFGPWRSAQSARAATVRSAAGVVAGHILNVLGGSAYGSMLAPVPPRNAWANLYSTRWHVPVARNRPSSGHQQSVMRTYHSGKHQKSCHVSQLLSTGKPIVWRTVTLTPRYVELQAQGEL